MESGGYVNKFAVWQEYVVIFFQVSPFLISLFLAQISRSYWLRYLFTYWWFLFSSFHQSCHCHASSIYARRGCTSKASSSDTYSSALRNAFLLIHGVDAWIDCENVAKSREQAFLCEGGIHDDPQPLRREQQSSHQSILEQLMWSWRFLWYPRGNYFHHNFLRWYWFLLL